MTSSSLRESGLPERQGSQLNVGQDTSSGRGAKEGGRLTDGPSVRPSVVAIIFVHWEQSVDLYLPISINNLGFLLLRSLAQTPLFSRRNQLKWLVQRPPNAWCTGRCTPPSSSFIPRCCSRVAVLPSSLFFSKTQQPYKRRRRHQQ